MFCTKCGKEITDGQRFCPGCGAENKNVSQQTYGSMNTSNTFDVSTVQNVLPMKWYKFLIYFALIGQILPCYTNEAGTGIVDMRILPEFIATFMRNGVFRSVIFFGMVLSEIACIILMVIEDRKFLKFNKDNIKSFLILLPILILIIMPIYAPETLFNTHTDLIFLRFSWMHILWIICLILEAVIPPTTFIKILNKYIPLFLNAIDITVTIAATLQSISGNLSIVSSPSDENS